MTETVHLHIQCKAPTGEIGSFLLDTTRNRLVSPVFADLVGLFAWARANSWLRDTSATVHQPYRGDRYVYRPLV